MEQKKSNKQVRKLSLPDVGGASNLEIGKPSDRKHLGPKGHKSDVDITRIGRVFRKSIMGDLFGSYEGDTNSFVNGLVYRTRLLAREDVNAEVNDFSNAETSAFAAALGDDYEVESDSDPEVC